MAKRKNKIRAAVSEAVKRDELIVDIETDKVVLEVVAPADGSIAEIIKGEGDTILTNEVIAIFVEGAVAAGAAPAAAPVAAAAPAGAASAEKLVNPAARKMADEKNVNTAAVDLGYADQSHRIILQVDEESMKKSLLPSLDQLGM